MSVAEVGSAVIAVVAEYNERRERERRDRLQLFAEVAVRWAADRDVSGTALSRLLGARKQTVLEILSALRAAEKAVLDSRNHLLGGGS